MCISSRSNDSDSSDGMRNLTKMGSVRWAFRFGNWQPTCEEWTMAARCVQPEEKDRIGKFVFKKDGKSAMV